MVVTVMIVFMDQALCFDFNPHNQSPMQGSYYYYYYCCYCYQVLKMKRQGWGGHTVKSGAKTQIQAG